MGENVVGLVFAAGDPTLLPEVGELVLQRPAGPQVEHKLSGEGVVQEGVVHVGEKPARQKKRLSSRGQCVQRVFLWFTFKLTNRTLLARCALRWTPVPSAWGKECHKDEQHKQHSASASSAGSTSCTQPSNKAMEGRTKR